MKTRIELRAKHRQQRLEVLKEAANGVGLSVAGMELAQWLLERQWTVFTNDEVWPACEYGWDGVVQGLEEAGYIRKHRKIAGMWVVKTRTLDQIRWNVRYGSRYFGGDNIVYPASYP